MKPNIQSKQPKIIEGRGVCVGWIYSSTLLVMFSMLSSTVISVLFNSGLEAGLSPESNFFEGKTLLYMVLLINVR